MRMSILPSFERFVRREPAEGFVAEVPLETVDESSREESQERLRDLGRASGLTCPDCNGAIWEVRDGQTVRFRFYVSRARLYAFWVAANSSGASR